MHLLSGKSRTRLLKLFELVFFPSFCFSCGRLLEKPGERVVCQDCWSQLRPLSPPFCLCCGRLYNGCGGTICASCLETPPEFSHHRSVCRYQGMAKELVHAYKYQKRKILGVDLARFMYSNLARDQGLWWGADAFVPVPLHHKRAKQRGFNQAHVLARELSKQSDLPCLAGILKKKRDAVPQAILSGDERRRNLKDVFSVTGSSTVKGKVVILVDDVYTTGTTIRECSRTLLAAGAHEVRAVTFAQA